MEVLRDVTFPPFFKSINCDFFFFLLAVLSGKKRKKTQNPFLPTRSDRRHKSPELWVGATRPHSFQQRAFIFPRSTGTQALFETYCPQLRPLWKATDVTKTITACPLSCFIFQGREKREPARERRPSLAWHRGTGSALEQVRLLTLAGRAERAAPVYSARGHS